MRSRVGKWIINAWTAPCGRKRGCQWDQEFHVFLFNICTKRWMEEWTECVTTCTCTCPGRLSLSMNLTLFFWLFFFLILFWGFVCLWLFICLFLFFIYLFPFVSLLLKVQRQCVVNTWGARVLGKIMSTFVSKLPRNHAQMSKAIAAAMFQLLLENT